ncbi:MAG: hypothetical protein JXA21_14695 [Anaerolineae bacterium]|nr:hypothetical protein [Anaerolineae bacterium]
MKYANTLFPLSILFSVVSLSLAYLQMYPWPALLAPVTLGVLWMVGFLIKAPWLRQPLRHIALAGFLFLVVLAGSRGLNAALTLAGLLAVLAAWSLAGFVERMRSVSRVEGAAGLEQGYLLRLGLVLLFSGALAGVALSVRVNLNFGVAFFLAFLIIIGASQAVAYLHRESD